MRVLFGLGLALAAGACAAAYSAQDKVAPDPGEGAALGREVEAPLIDTSGQRIGQARLKQGPKGVLVTIEVSPGRLPVGWHGLHFHLRGDCSDPDKGFVASGAHVGHGAGMSHGLLHPSGPESGDLPNIFMPETSGPMAWEVYSDMVTLAPAARGGLAALLGPSGSALVIHANRDDHATQPIGGAGPRIACAVVSPAKP
jgi:Cu-Zn family superoxide dismutase